MHCKVEQVLANGVLRVHSRKGSFYLNVPDAWKDDATFLSAGISLFLHDVAVVGNSLHPGAAFMFVLEPSVLVNVTDVAGAIVDGTEAPMHSFANRFAARSVSHAVAAGFVANTAFDIMLESPRMNVEVLTDEAMRRSWSILLEMAVNTAIMSDVRESVEAIVRAMQRDYSKIINSNAQVEAETAFVSTSFGMQGRFDILRRHESYWDIIELKCGAPPAPTLALADGPKSVVAGIKGSHAAQLIAYSMIAQEVAPDVSVRCYAWYPRHADAPVRLLPDLTHWPSRIIKVRNQIVGAELRLSHRSLNPVDIFCSATQPGLPAYIIHSSASLLATYSNLDADSKIYFRAWAGYLASEAIAARQSTNDKKADHCVVDWHVSDLESRHLVLTMPADNEDLPFRTADPVILIPESGSGVVKGLVYKGVIKTRNHLTLEVSLRNKFVTPQSLKEVDTWVIANDPTDIVLSRLYRALMVFAGASLQKRQLITGLAAPAFDAAAPIISNVPHDQAKAISQAVSARDYVLIQGPPGSGKTTVVLANIVRELLSNPEERILLCAYTNRAADQIVRVVADIIPHQHIRIGSKDGSIVKERHLAAMARDLSPVRLRDEIAQSRCVITTLAAYYTSPAPFELKPFTTAIIDEATQAPEPMIAGIMALVQRTIMIGDECQLPTVVTQHPERLVIDSDVVVPMMLNTLDRSIFERLMAICTERGWDDAVVRLGHQGRMHETIMQVASELYYGGRLRPLADWQRQPLSWTESLDSSVHHLLASRLVFVDTGSVSEHVEARYAALIASLIYPSLDEHGMTLGVISPRRANNARIKGYLPPNLNVKITVDTVERFQGSERDAIIYAPGVTDERSFDTITSISRILSVEVDRKLNVAITRGRHFLILVGNGAVLRTNPHYRTVIDKCSQVKAQDLT